MIVCLCGLQASLRSFVEVWNETMAKKMKLRQENLSVSYEEFEKLISAKKLDSNLKKCTSFVKKMVCLFIMHMSRFLKRNVAYYKA